MIDNIELESRLRGWAREYGLGGLPSIGGGKHILQTLAEHGGFLPSTRVQAKPVQTPADEVEKAVWLMEQSGWFREGRVLRCDYYCPDQAMDSRLQRLRRIGLAMSRAGYYNALDRAKLYVAGSLALIHKRAIANPCV